jgi:hypothetical protein
LICEESYTGDSFHRTADVGQGFSPATVPLAGLKACPT